MYKKIKFICKKYYFHLKFCWYNIWVSMLLSDNLDFRWGYKPLYVLLDLICKSPVSNSSTDFPSYGLLYILTFDLYFNRIISLCIFSIDVQFASNILTPTSYINLYCIFMHLYMLQGNDTTVNFWGKVVDVSYKQWGP